MCKGVSCKGYVQGSIVRGICAADSPELRTRVGESVSFSSQPALRNPLHMSLSQYSLAYPPLRILPSNNTPLHPPSQNTLLSQLPPAHTPLRILPAQNPISAFLKRHYQQSGTHVCNTTLSAHSYRELLGIAERRVAKKVKPNTKGQGLATHGRTHGRTHAWQQCKQRPVLNNARNPSTPCSPLPPSVSDEGRREVSEVSKEIFHEIWNRQ